MMKVHNKSNVDTEKDKKQQELMQRKEADDSLKEDCCSIFYYDDKTEADEKINHFKQEEVMRNEDLEEMAYKRYMRKREKNKTKESKVKDMLKLQSSRLQAIKMDLSQMKNQTTEAPIREDTQFDSSSTPQSSRTMESGVTGKIKREVELLNGKVANITKRIDSLSNDIAPILQYVQRKMSKRKTALQS